MRKFKGIKGKWRAIENVVRADFIGASHQICEVNSKMSYPATEKQGDANLKLIVAAPELLEAIEYYFDVLREVQGKNFDKKPDHVLLKMLQAVKKATE